MSEEAGADSCAEVIRYIQAHDPTQRQSHDAIPARERELADDLSELIETLDVEGAPLIGFSAGGGEVARDIGRHGTKRVARAALVAAALR